MVDCGNKINILPWRYKRRESWVIVYLSWSCAFLYERLIYLCIYLGRGRVDGGYLILMKCIPQCFSAFWVLCISPSLSMPWKCNNISVWGVRTACLLFLLSVHLHCTFKCCWGNKWARHRCNMGKHGDASFLLARMKKRHYVFFAYGVTQCFITLCNSMFNMHVWHLVHVSIHNMKLKSLLCNKMRITHVDFVTFHCPVSCLSAQQVTH